MPRQRTPVHGSTAALAMPDVGPLDVASVVDAAPARGQTRAFGPWLRTWGLHVEVLGSALAGVVAAFLTTSRPEVALLALVVWMLSVYHTGQAVTTPLTRQLRALVRGALLPLAGVALAIGFLGLSPAVVPPALAAVGSATVTAAVCRCLRRRLQAPIRVVVVGTRSEIATAAVHWAGTTRVRPVGGLIVEPELSPDLVPSDLLGVPTVLGLDSAKALVESWQADLVLVRLDAGVSSPEFRRLTWALEDSRVAIGVAGVLDSVAPHRITPGMLERTGVIGVRSPRPSTVVRTLKAVSDRVVGLVLLVLAAPLLALLALAVRLDSKGPAFYRQTRVGRHGRAFKLYKLRTMVMGADELKHDLADVNEYDAVLFKIPRDPRITRIGGFLRRSSLDELPQLINVVRGEMSLIGPRPYVPEEVARMDGDTLRRHAVQPGITGLWQVSGRSDLAWDDSAALDMFYADNWSLVEDAKIAAKTVKAVLGAKGAY